MLWDIFGNKKAPWNLRSCSQESLKSLEKWVNKDAITDCEDHDTILRRYLNVSKMRYSRMKWHFDILSFNSFTCWKKCSPWKLMRFFKDRAILITQFSPSMKKLIIENLKGSFLHSIFTSVVLFYMCYRTKIKTLCY